MALEDCIETVLKIVLGRIENFDPDAVIEARFSLPLNSVGHSLRPVVRPEENRLDRSVTSSGSPSKVRFAREVPLRGSTIGPCVGGRSTFNVLAFKI
jgi:hypothetical protein